MQWAAFMVAPATSVHFIAVLASSSRLVSSITSRRSQDTLKQTTTSEEPRSVKTSQTHHSLHPGKVHLLSEVDSKDLFNMSPSKPLSQIASSSNSLDRFIMFPHAPFLQTSRQQIHTAL